MVNDGGWWWINFGLWWVVVDIFWLVVGGDEWWRFVAYFSLAHFPLYRSNNICKDFFDISIFHFLNCS